MKNDVQCAYERADSAKEEKQKIKVSDEKK